MSNMRQYWAVVPAEPDVLKTTRPRVVNQELLPIGYIAAYRSFGDLLSGLEMVGVCCSASFIDPHVVVQVEADIYDMVMPYKDPNLDSVFIKPLNVVSSEPLKDWLEQMAQSDDPSIAEKARWRLSDIQISLDNPIEDDG